MSGPIIWVRILSQPSRQFYLDADALPLLDAQQARHALLLGVGILRIGTDGESANIEVTLRNDAGQATRLFATPPLAATVEIYDGDAVVFVGAVTAVTLGDTCTVQVEA